MATHSIILAWKIPWTEEPGGFQSMESPRVRHDRATNTSPCVPVAERKNLGQQDNLGQSQATGSNVLIPETPPWLNSAHGSLPSQTIHRAAWSPAKW